MRRFFASNLYRAPTIDMEDQGDNEKRTRDIDEDGNQREDVRNEVDAMDMQQHHGIARREIIPAHFISVAVLEYCFI